ncbi:hypothetical protein [Kitasatospora sp. NPDC091207]|uniref:hypothetical protein n=1 Tax=Kitasatospora sp. NPDC091207 TaxID=3364083 RepID=UPI00380E1714
MRRWAWWTAAGVCAVAGTALVAVPVLVDLETADRLASMTGALAALVGLAVTVRGLLRGAPAGMPAGRDGVRGGGDPAAAGGVREVRVVAENGGVGAAGDITAVGAGPPSAPSGGDASPRVDKREVRATGPGSVAAGGDIHGIDLEGPRR